MNIHWGEATTYITAAASGIAAILSAIAAFLAWRTAVRSAETADTVARIERERWHAELTPEFSFTLTETGSGHALLNVHLDGPDSLHHLDSVTIAVGNDDMGHELLHAGVDVTQADVDAFVWGPYKFSHGANGTDEHGRGPAPFPLQVGRGQRRAMQRTQPGHWMTGKTQGVWQREYAGQPIRLNLTCQRENQEWVIARRLVNPPFPSED